MRNSREFGNQATCGRAANGRGVNGEVERSKWRGANEEELRRKKVWEEK